MTAPRLGRAACAAQGSPHPVPPVRIVHLGAGAFFRAHQAWYTTRAGDGWGIAAFTGRSARGAQALAAQDGLFTVVERGPRTDRFDLVDSIAEAHPAARHDRLLALMAAPTTAVITLTVTEQGYRLRPDGTLDLADPGIAADVAALRAGGVPTTPLGRLTAGLAARAARGAEPLAVVPCDNVPAVGARVGAAVADVAAACGLMDAPRAASFVSTSVDRITPHTDVSGIVTSATGWRDEAAVVTEPFHDWTLCGDFPSGRPAWEQAGARFVDDIAAFERRKLILLNGGHLAVTFAGLRRGCATVDEAVREPACRRILLDFWSEAKRSLPAASEADAYCAALLTRFENPRIAHRLDQIAADTVTKLRMRVLPVIENELAQGRGATAALRVVSEWGAAWREGRLPGVRSAAPGGLSGDAAGPTATQARIGLSEGTSAPVALALALATDPPSGQ